MIPFVVSAEEVRPVYIKRLVIENLKGFRKADLNFARPGGIYKGWTVITGDNASGKTTLLKAIALALVGPDVARALQPSLKGWVKRGMGEAVIALEIIAEERDRFAQGRRPEKPFWSELKLIENGGPEVSIGLGNKYKGKEKGPTHGPWTENPSGWYAAGYGPFRRLYGASPDAQRIMSGPSKIARFATMFREDATLGECERWLIDLRHKQFEDRTKEAEILTQIMGLLNDDFLRNGLRVEKVDSEGLWLLDSTSTSLPLADMSEGYRAALAMLTDILRHLVDVYGHEGFVTQSEAGLICPHSGVVLIDEADSHLHPEWQRQIGFWLKKHFPLIQFIVTTHSALICQAADENGIFHLPPPGNQNEPFRIADDDYRKIIAAKTDTILLSPAFDMQYTRSPRAVERREKYAKLNAKQKAGVISESEKEEIKLLWDFVSADGEEAT
jgi:energy-coupling factor transporter ATP-binding protein EcfA2